MPCLSLSASLVISRTLRLSLSLLLSLSLSFSFFLSLSLSPSLSLCRSISPSTSRQAVALKYRGSEEDRFKRPLTFAFCFPVGDPAFNGAAPAPHSKRVGLFCRLVLKKRPVFIASLFFVCSFLSLSFSVCVSLSLFRFRLSFCRSVSPSTSRLSRA